LELPVEQFLFHMFEHAYGGRHYRFHIVLAPVAPGIWNRAAQVGWRIEQASQYILYQIIGWFAKVKAK